MLRAVSEKVLVSALLHRGVLLMRVESLSLTDRLASWHLPHAWYLSCVVSLHLGLVRWVRISPILQMKTLRLKLRNLPKVMQLGNPEKP